MRLLRKFAVYTLLMLPLTITQKAHAYDMYLGEVFLVGMNFCPRNSIEASGQLLEISTNTALFSLYGTRYGGNGRNTFAVPDMRNTVQVKDLKIKYCVQIEGLYPSRP